MPLISVIIPVYNGEKTIRETIESVLNQTFRDFELLIINDGSSDLTLETVYSIQDTRLKVFSYSNAGLSASRNRGLVHACGKYVSFIDADDLWTPQKLEDQLKALQANPQAAVAYSWTDCIDEVGRFSRRGSYITATGYVYARLLIIDFIENGSNPLIDRQAFKKVGGFDESLSAAEDRDMWLRLAAHYHFIAVPSPQVLYRMSSHSMSANVTRQEVASLQMIEKAFVQAPKSLQHLKVHSIANLYKSLIFKALEGSLEQGQGLIAARFLWQAIRYDTTFLQSRVIWKVLLKIVIMVMLPSKYAQVLFAKFKAIFNTKTILGYLRLDPS